jgi:hypothetical protein
MYNTSTANGWNSIYLQMHGMAPSSCGSIASTPDVLLSNGVNTAAAYPSGCLVLAVKAAILATAYPQNYTAVEAVVNCNSYGSALIQGRLVNGVAPANVCPTAATTPSHKFLYMDFKPAPRNVATSQVYLYDVLKSTISTDCASGRSYDSTSKMCV